MRLSIKATAPTARPTPATVGIGGPATRNVTITPSPVEDNPTEPVFFASANLSQSITRASSSERCRWTSRLTSVVIGSRTDKSVGVTPASNRHAYPWRTSLTPSHFALARSAGDACVAPTESAIFVDHRLNPESVQSVKSLRSPHP